MRIRSKNPITDLYSLTHDSYTTHVCKRMSSNIPQELKTTSKLQLSAIAYKDTAASIPLPAFFKLVDYINHGAIEYVGDDYHIHVAWCVICSPKQHVNHHCLPATCTPLLRTCQRIPFQDSEGKICAREFSSFLANDKNLFN
jgi:hypothetical protein